MTPADAAVIIAALIISVAPEIARIITADRKDKRAPKAPRAPRAPREPQS